MRQAGLSPALFPCELAQTCLRRRFHFLARGGFLAIQSCGLRVYEGGKVPNPAGNTLPRKEILASLTIRANAAVLRGFVSITGEDESPAACNGSPRRKERVAVSILPAIGQHITDKGNPARDGANARQR